MCFIKQYLDAFLHLWYPHICLSCGTDQLVKKNVLCNQCIQSLPYTDFSNEIDNPIQKIFWGRVSFTYANALLFFTKDSIVQLLITQLKYHQNKKAGWMLGRLMGMCILKKMNSTPIDYLLPIPITAHKKKLRNFNQSELLCQGIQSITGLPILTDILLKPYDSLSQTHKDRIKRMDAIGQSFMLDGTWKIKNKHVLLIDDVLTTGATLEAAGMLLQDIENIQLSLFTATYTI
jgi:ComF family protein